MAQTRVTEDNASAYLIPLQDTLMITKDGSHVFSISYGKGGYRVALQCLQTWVQGEVSRLAALEGALKTP